MASTNKTEVETKVISVRVSVNEYIVILSEALEAKVPLSDFIKNRIFKEDTKELDKCKKEKDELQLKYIDLKLENSTLKRDIKKLKTN